MDFRRNFSAEVIRHAGELATGLVLMFVFFSKEAIIQVERIAGEGGDPNTIYHSKTLFAFLNVARPFRCPPFALDTFRYFDPCAKLRRVGD